MSATGRSLVTGGAGFIGSHLADALVARGDEVRVVDDLSTGKLENLDRARQSSLMTFREGDIAKAGGLAEAVAGFEPTTIFHMAGQADARKAIANPIHDSTINVLGTIHVLEVARELGSSVIFSSTGGVSYGEGEGRRLPFVEGDATLPETAYGVSKLAAEMYVSFYRLIQGVRGTSLRLGNVYGPRQDPHGEAGVIAIFCGRLLAEEAPLVYGDGLQTRDYVFIDDIVAGLLAAGDALEAGAELEPVYNVGTGVEVTVIELAEQLSAIAESELGVEHRPPRKGEISRVAIDPAAAHRDLGWEATKPLREGLAETFAWAQENRGVR